jgi:hypothetical protein
MLAYSDACDLEDELLRPHNVRAWVEGFSGAFSFHDETVILRAVGDGGERLLGALAYVGSYGGEIACRSTDYTGRPVALVFTTAVSALGLDRIAAQCRALGATSVEAWGCVITFHDKKTEFIDNLHLVEGSPIIAR